MRVGAIEAQAHGHSVADPCLSEQKDPAGRRSIIYCSCATPRPSSGGRCMNACRPGARCPVASYCHTLFGEHPFLPSAQGAAQRSERVLGASTQRHEVRSGAWLTPCSLADLSRESMSSADLEMTKRDVARDQFYIRCAEFATRCVWHAAAGPRVARDRELELGGQRAAPPAMLVSVMSTRRPRARAVPPSPKTCADACKLAKF